MRRLAVALALALALTPVIAPAAQACGGLFCQRVPVDQAGERILFATDGQSVTAHVQIQYQGEASKFSWIVPVPTAPKLGVGSDAFFQVLRSATRPTWRIDIEDNKDCEAQPVGASFGRAVPSAPQEAGDSSVQIISQEQVGAFDAVVLKATDASDLKKWLKDNEYTIPEKLDPLLDPYVAGRYFFVALKLVKNAAAGDIQPIVMKYESPKPGIPIRLTGVAATTDMDVYVWVLGKNRAIPENYRHAEINEARINWFQQGANYRTVVTEAMNDAGGQAFVTDYAGKSDIVNTDQFDPGQFDLEKIRAAKDAEALATELGRGGYFNTAQAAVLPFLKRHVPKPATAASITDDDFYGYLTYLAQGGSKEGISGSSNFEPSRAALEKAQLQLDSDKAALELDERVVTPYREIQAMFKQYPYLTQMYTTMSPDEMTQDPLFLSNPDLPEVSNQHVAKGVRRCAKGVSFFDAPVEITLANGLKYTTTQAQAGGTQPSPSPGESPPLALPAARKIEQLKSKGAASVIQDNFAAIQKILGGGVIVKASVGGGVSVIPRGGSSSGSAGNAVPAAGVFGCTSCAGAAGKVADNGPWGGVGEGLTYASAFLGFLGYRRFRRRKVH